MSRDASRCDPIEAWTTAVLRSLKDAERAALAECQRQFQQKVRAATPPPAVQGDEKRERAR